MQYKSPLLLVGDDQRGMSVHLVVRRTQRRAVNRRAAKAIPLAGLILVATSCFPPSDAALQRTFERHRSSLEQLRAMADSDYQAARVIRIAPAFTRLEHNWGWPRHDSLLGITRTRWDEYRRLFKRAGIAKGLNRDGQAYEEIFFAVWGYGLADNSRERGIVYSPSALQDINHSSQQIHFSPLAEDWYIYEWRTW
jgi:hypothetical protein